MTSPGKRPDRRSFLTPGQARQTGPGHTRGAWPGPASYITHHLRLAGRSDPLFSDAITLIHQTARGLTRAAS